MQVGVVDLGPVGAHLVGRLISAGHQCVVYDECPRLVAEIAAGGAYGVSSLSDLARELDAPRTIVLATPPAAVDRTIACLVTTLEPEDLVVDCTDSFYVEDIRRAGDLAAAGIHYVDVGISGGAGDEGHCLTIGGEERIVRQLDPLFRDLAMSAGRARCAGGSRPARTSEDGYLHCGPAGAGHFVNMVHTGIEHCLMEAYAEGFSILRGAQAGRGDRGAEATARCMTCPPRYGYDFNLAEIAEVWRHGSPIASSVLNLTAGALAEDPAVCEGAAAAASASGEWLAVRTAGDRAVPVPIMASAMYRGMGPRTDGSFSSRLLAAVRRHAPATVGMRAYDRPRHVGCRDCTAGAPRLD